MQFFVRSDGGCSTRFRVVACSFGSLSGMLVAQEVDEWVGVNVV